MYQIRTGAPVEKVLKKALKSDTHLYEAIKDMMRRIVENPEIGKPLRHEMKYHRRVQMGSYVLLYEIGVNTIFFLDYDHHDKVYKKYR